MWCQSKHKLIPGVLLGMACLIGGSRPASAATPKGWDPAGLALRLKDPDPEAQSKALGKVSEWFNVDPGDAARELRLFWADALWRTRKYSELAELTQAGVLAVPRDTVQVEDLLQWRVKALLALGQPQLAIQVAKSLFNVARPQNTPAALLLLADCLERCHPEDPQIYSKFQAQEMAGADLKAKSPRSPLLDAIHVEASAYQPLIDKYAQKDLSDDRDILTLGNLQLLSDQPEKAEQTFGMLSGSSRDKVPAEAMARAIKAEDGTIARANRYLLEEEEP